ncbi:MAG: ABC transporter ATP-binding protein [Candidatus Kapabacteria bacterium]|jgi:spermidine/putrescine transport system ATP-binding protein|nr:ABC transporter ATP-binding protein [Candidatus Kapabacteria bacterium]
MPILTLSNIEKYYGASHVVKNLNLAIEAGEFLTILGPSGCGKTTTLRMIGGFELPTSGTITLKDEDISLLPPYKRHVNTVFQNYALFPNMNVEQNIAFGLKQKKGTEKMSASQIQQRVEEMLQMVQMTDFSRRKPQELSGGQQQRIAIARAVANNPEILLLDEPLGALDLKLRKQMQSELKSLQKRLGKTFVYVTHDQEEALTMSDRIAVMNGGNLEQIGTSNEMYYHPETPFVAEFIGESNKFEARATKTQNDGSASISAGSVYFPVSASTHKDPLREGQKVIVFLRPEAIRIHPANTRNEGALKGILQEIIFVGSTRKYRIDLKGELLLTALETTLGEASYSVGDEVALSWKPEDCSIFA